MALDQSWIDGLLQGPPGDEGPPGPPGPSTGLWTYQATATFASHPAMSAATWQVQPIDTSGGSFTLTLPTTPTKGDRIDVYDVVATSPTTGIGANPCSLQGGTIDIQDKHTMAVSGVAYVFGTASGDAGGATLSIQYTGVFWKAIGT